MQVHICDYILDRTTNCFTRDSATRVCWLRCQIWKVTRISSLRYMSPCGWVNYLLTLSVDIIFDIDECCTWKAHQCYDLPVWIFKVFWTIARSRDMKAVPLKADSYILQYCQSDIFRFAPWYSRYIVISHRNLKNQDYCGLANWATNAQNLLFFYAGLIFYLTKTSRDFSKDSISKYLLLV